jgi:hypothetical protein
MTKNSLENKLDGFIYVLSKTGQKIAANQKRLEYRAVIEFDLRSGVDYDTDDVVTREGRVYSSVPVRKIHRMTKLGMKAAFRKQLKRYVVMYY